MICLLNLKTQLHEFTFTQCYKSFFIFSCIKLLPNRSDSHLKGWQALNHDLRVRSNLPEKQWSHFPSRLDRYLASFKLYLLLLVIHLSLFLLIYSELNFILLRFSLAKGQVASPASYKTSSSNLTNLTLFRMGFFGAAHGCGGAFLPPLPKICHAYPTMVKLGTVIPYLKKIQKI